MKSEKNFSALNRLVPRPIADNLKKVGIERRGIFKAGGAHFPEVTGQTLKKFPPAGLLWLATGWRQS